LRALEALRAQGFTLHLADGAIVEMTNQIWQGRFKWENWKAARSHLKRLLDDRDPILLGGLRWFATEHLLVDPPPRFMHPPRGELRIETTEGWYRLLKARSRKELETPSLMFIGGKAFYSYTAARHAQAILDEERATWLGDFAEILRLSTETATTQALAVTIPQSLESVFAQIDARARPGWPPLSLRLDATIRVLMRYHEMNLNEDSGYSPASKGRRNDAVDFSLLSYLGQPAILCTWDGGLKKAVVAAGSWQQRWILGKDELEALPGTPPPDMTWPREPLRDGK
jgi:hypothetical protein